VYQVGKEIKQIRKPSIKLMVFERKVLRMIFGPTKERDGTWRVKKTMN